MAKTLGERSKLIRAAIVANPGMANKELAQKFNSAPERATDKFKVTNDDIAQQKLALNKLAANAKKPGANGKKPSAPKAPPAAVAAATAAPTARQPVRSSDLVAAMASIKGLVNEFGADTVRGLVALFEPHN